MSVYRLIKITGLSSTQLYELVKKETIPDETQWATLKKIRDALNLECVDQLESND